MRSRSMFAAVAVLALAPWSGPGHAAVAPASQDRSVDPIVLTGALLPAWSAGPEVSAREPQISSDPAHVQSDCRNDTYEDTTKDHHCYQSSRVPISALPGRTGADVSKLLGYRWDPAAQAFAQIPFQVDERFTRYLTNNQSGFAFYSGADAHNTYAFDREGFRFTSNLPYDAANPAGTVCHAVARNEIVTTPDPVPGLDDNDELVFMYSDAGVDAAPGGTPLPAGISGAAEVRVADPSNPGEVRIAYVMLSGPGGPGPAFDATNGYVRYLRDPDADLFVNIQSGGFGGLPYGNEPKGPYCKPDGTLVSNPSDPATWKQRRPKDTAWIYTPRYKFRYEGRWLMTELHVHDPGQPAAVTPGEEAIAGANYGPDLIDRWKARAFAQDPSSDTPCCGFEEEDTNWGGSSILMGERAGPVRMIRETWGADSSTNNARREVFYRDVILFGDALRVHPIPPVDGIYVQWDYNAGVMSTYYNPSTPEGVAIDGHDDEIVGNLDDPCNSRYDANPRSQIDETYRQTYRSAGLCPPTVEYHQSIDVFDPTRSNPEGFLQWEEIAGPHGTLVTRWSTREVTPGGAAQGLLAVPYYRDNSCFDDGTGSSPGPKLRLRSGDEPTMWFAGDGTSGNRVCWEPGMPIDPGFVNHDPVWGDREGDEHYFQGSIGTHGLHLLLVAESDNLMLTVPVTEIDSEQRMVVLPGGLANVGETYGRGAEFPLQVVARPWV